MDVDRLRRFERLSPFEIKDELARLATRAARASAHVYLNAGRGNPNWVATAPRDAFFLLGQFALTESRRVRDLPGGLGGMPRARGIARRLSSWLRPQATAPGAGFLRKAVQWAVSRLGFERDAFVHELVDAVLGGHYPVPDRMLVHTERIVHAYLQWAMCGSPVPPGRFDLFAVEGGTAAICYLLKSLRANRLLQAGDTIALGVPIFTPYLEIPRLEDYDLKVVEVHAAPDAGYQYPAREIDRLRDPKVKAFFVVNPGNPTAVAMSDETIRRIGRVLRARPDLMLLTDDVYGTFVPGFRSLLGAFPHNTVGVYSFSKYFGCTGWRLGVIAVHERNVFDRRIAALPESAHRRLDRRYGSLTVTPRRLRFIDRVVADSRDVALKHTAGLSPPQQAMMALLSLGELMDTGKRYQRACLDLLARRVAATREGLGADVAPGPLFDGYYGLIDIEALIRRHAGDEVARWLVANVHPLDLVFRLAEKHGIVLLNGSGFEAPDWSARISFANLDDDAYDDIGRAVRAVAREYYLAWRRAGGVRARNRGADEGRAVEGQAVEGQADAGRPGRAARRPRNRDQPGSPITPSASSASTSSRE